MSLNARGKIFLRSVISTCSSNANDWSKPIPPVQELGDLAQFEQVVEQVKDTVVECLRVRDRVSARERARGTQRESDLSTVEIEQEGIKRCT
jgi:hypothetical protein